MNATELYEDGCPLCWPSASSTMHVVGQTHLSYVVEAPPDMNADYVIAPKHHAERADLLPDLWHRQLVIGLHKIPRFDEWDGYGAMEVQPTLRDPLSHVHVLVIRRYDEGPEASGAPWRVQENLGRAALQRLRERTFLHD